MALNDRFTEYYAEDATASHYRRELPNERWSSSANRRLVDELANRACVIEALREKKSVQERLGRRQDVAFGRGRPRSNYMGRQHNISVHDRLGYARRRNYNLPVYDRLGRVRGRGRRNFKSGISPLNRDDFEFQKSGFEKKRQTEFRRGEFQTNRRSSDSNNIYVKVRNDRFQHKADMDDMRLEVASRADPAGIFYYHNGIRYYESEIFIWITEHHPFD